MNCNFENLHKLKNKQKENWTFKKPDPDHGCEKHTDNAVTH
jgi:hypothetical protein